MRHPVDIKKLHRLLYYDPGGELYWRSNGAEAFTAKWAKKYHGGRVNSVKLLKHQVVWALCNNQWPKYEIDHINGNRFDNRIENLRDVPRYINGRNNCLFKHNTSGIMGVSKHGSNWRAVIKVNQKYIHLGTFKTIEEAAQARCQAEKKYDFHPNHGRLPVATSV